MKGKKLTVDEIIKGLDNLSYYHDEKGVHEFLRGAIGLIQEQKAEIERLTREEYEAYTFIKHKYGNQDAIMWSELVDGLYEFARVFSKEMAEKFAERLKESETIKEIAENGYIVSYVELCNKIDEIAKEFTEGKE